MEVVYSSEELEAYMHAAVSVSNDAPVLLDRFLESATELDVDAVSDGEDVLVGGIMEHIEQAGIHSGDSACALPPHGIDADTCAEIERQVKTLARALNVIGLMNVQFAIQDGEVYILEVNPRASRTVPFVSKATGLPLAKIAVSAMLGRSLLSQALPQSRTGDYCAVKEAVFPFVKFPGVDPILGPEMKSTGEVMGIGRSFAEAFAKAQQAANIRLPQRGKAFLSVRDVDKQAACDVARQLIGLGFNIVATRGTAQALEAAGVPCERINKVREGQPHIVDLIKSDEVEYVINTTQGKRAIDDSSAIREAALQRSVPYTTTLAGAQATAMALSMQQDFDVIRLQSLHEEVLQ